MINFGAYSSPRSQPGARPGSRQRRIPAGELRLTSASAGMGSSGPALPSLTVSAWPSRRLRLAMVDRSRQHMRAVIDRIIAGAGNARVVAVLRNPHCRARRLNYVAIFAFPLSAADHPVPPSAALWQLYRRAGGCQMIIGRDKTGKSGDAASAPPETIHDLMPAAGQRPAAPLSAVLRSDRGARRRGLSRRIHHYSGHRRPGDTIAATLKVLRQPTSGAENCRRVARCLGARP